MSENLTPEQIEAMLSNMGSLDMGLSQDVSISDEEKDILGEIGNMCMGASATTMYTILNRKVSITTPKVTIYPNIVSMLEEYNIPFIVVMIDYTEGVRGRNLLLLKTSDTALITDIMLGNDGTDVDLENVELSELHLSAISEIMNQMVAAAATSLSQILGSPVNISPPQATLVDLAVHDANVWDTADNPLVKISFKLEIENLLNSELMQVMPYSFAKELVGHLLAEQDASAAAPPEAPAPPPSAPPPAAPAAPPPQYAPPQEPQYAAPPPPAYDPQYAPPPQYAQQPYPPPYPQQQYAAPYPPPPQYAQPPPVNVQPVQYQTFDRNAPSFANVGENLDMIIDVPLQVAVELGRARRSIREVLDVNVGSVIVLEKLAGELVEVNVNGKLIARGEVVVIDENYGVRITEIVAPNRRV